MKSSEINIPYVEINEKRTFENKWGQNSPYFLYKVSSAARNARFHYKFCWNPFF